ncbi:MAG: hypothetical protein JRJ00_00355 [Deltaproteobacteria bacterium]|nr:hypothetical protein [Deltaproteobacteria bacterium]
MGDMESKMQSLIEGSTYLMGEWYKELDNAFNARLEYEMNCFRKYDRPNMPSLTPIKGERMGDYARKFNTSIDLMKEVLPSVERHIEENRLQ